MNATSPRQLEWLETDGLGGFAMGTVEGAGGGIRTRRYHGLLIAPTTPGDPAARTMLINGFDAWVQTPNGRFDLTAQRYAPDVIHPQPECEVESFNIDPWPRWVFRLGDGTRIEHELFMRHGSPLVAVTWRLCEPAPGVQLFVRPFFSGRDYHALHHENSQFNFTPQISNGLIAWRPYESLPAIITRTNGSYGHDPQWYRNFMYQQERDRGFDGAEDLASPGIFTFDLSADVAVWMLAAEDTGSRALDSGGTVQACLRRLRQDEHARRQAFASRLHLAGDQYLVARGEGKTIIAGYPWFADWGRDTFIAMRGLCLAAGRLDEARQILLAWSQTISQGMLPNRFADSSSDHFGGMGGPEYNSVDASLWYVIAVHEFLESADHTRFAVSPADRRQLQQSIQAVIEGYANGTRYGIRRDDDGLLAAGEKGQQLTWMDARVDGREITPRIGKPVEIQALWLNALWIAGQTSERWLRAFEQGRRSFRDRFWNESAGCLYDVIDVDHIPGAVDPSIRPNQIFAVGGLPMPLIEGEQARQIVNRAFAELWTPLGPRSLSTNDPRFAPRYEGGPAQRDAAYHHGPVWPWLAGAFIEAWVRVNGGTVKAKRTARANFLDPLLNHLSNAGLGHVSEIADGAAPHTPRGCPFQAWSVGELLRLDQVVLADSPSNASPMNTTGRNGSQRSASGRKRPSPARSHT